MNLREYVQMKSSMKKGMTAAELRLVGIPWPPIKGWVKIHGHKEIDEETFLKMQDAFYQKDQRQQIAMQGALQAQERQAKKAQKKASRKARRSEWREHMKNAYKFEFKSSPKPPSAPLVSMPAPKVVRSSVDPKSNEFLQSYEWRTFRMMAIEKYGRVCQCCGASPKTGAVINVDHVKPRKLFPHLALDIDNLQILCHECNHGKGNWSQTDWRDMGDKDAVLDYLDRVKTNIKR